MKAMLKKGEAATDWRRVSGTADEGDAQERGGGIWRRL